MTLRSRMAFAGFIAICLTVGSGGNAPTAAQNQRVEWYAVDDQLDAKGQSLSLGDNTHSLNLTAGWVCSVGSTSKQLPSYEARTTVCRKGSESIEFTTQCERSRPEDHTQIRFRVAGRFQDFIQVSCELIS